METKDAEIETVTLRKRKRETERVKSITLYIQAHGNIISGEYIDPKLSDGCEILSFTGGIGRSGIMKTYCDGVRMGPILLPDDKQLLPTIEVEGQQLDMMALLYIQQVYRNINENSFIDDTNKKSEISLSVVKNNISKIYENCNVTDFPRSKIPDIPFITIPAQQNKHYQLRPNEHEDCEFRGKCGRLGCSLREKREQVCPYYGVYVVYSTIPEDIDATLCGREDNHVYSNLNIREGYTAKQYWLDKIEEHMNGKIADAVASNNIIQIAEKARIIRLYEQMTRLLVDDSPISDEIIMETPLPEINLSQILEIFKIGMGYDEIIIIDPSCDTCIYSNNPFKIFANKQLRISRQSRQSRQNSKTTLGGKKHRRKHKTRKSKTPRKRKTYKKRKHIKMSYK
jgi:hypothetical protein